MSNLKYAIVESEADATSTVEQAPKQQAKPYLVPAGQPVGVSITNHAERALDFALAHGSMPA